MPPRLILILVLGVVVPGSSVAAQDRPDFSGTWSLPPDAPLAPNGKPAAAPGFGPTINIRHDTGSITIGKMMGGTTVDIVHPLDGHESRSRTPGRLCEGDSQSVWTASWQGDAITTILVGSFPPGSTAMTKMEVKTVFRLQAPDTMTVEMTFRNPGMKEPRTITTLYRRTGPPAALPAPGEPPLQARISQLAWLGGTWVGTTASGTIEERWTPPAGGSMLAISRTIRNGVMSAFEFLCLVEREGGLVYQAMPNGRQPATDFRLTKLEPDSLTFENPAHDFPKVIRYALAADGTLEATISGTGKQKPLTFRYARVKP